MRWQRAAQAIIALFVVGFVVLLVITLRKESGPAQAPPAVIPPPLKGTTLANVGGCEQVSAAGGKRLLSIKCREHFSFTDGRQRLVGDVVISLPRNDREFLLKADEANIRVKEATIEQADFTGNVSITTESGLLVTAKEASYAESTGIVTVPGAVQFSKGRMKGSGVGATYDRNRETFWIQDQGRIEVAPDAKANSGPMEGTAARIGMARTDHYIRLEGNGRIVSEGRTLEADVIGIRLTENDEQVRSMELRTNSRISGGTGGPQGMSARDIDLAYAEDGRTLQRAVLTENAAVQLAAASAGAGKRISGAAIDMTMGPDGSTVTNMIANGNVVVDMPAEKNIPAKRICSPSLNASGSGGGGIQAATFSGGVEYIETRPASRGSAAQSRCRGSAAPSRTARSDTLVLATAPGLGEIQQADFRGNATFTDGTDFSAEAPLAIYQLQKDRLQLSPGEGLPGKAPLVRDKTISIAARTIDIALPTRDLVADTRVKSTMLPQKKGAAPANDRRLPAMLKSDKTVYVTANRLQYQGNASIAHYTGDATLWQDEDSQIKGASILIDDKKGNLTATGNVSTRFFVEEEDRKSGTRTPVETRGTSETFTYDDAKRLATYTTKARLVGAQGDITGDKIELFMKPAANELERAEVYGTVTVKQKGRIATGTHLTYTAATDEYLMVGAPVEIIEAQKDGCSQTVAANASFNRTSEAALAKGEGTSIPMRTQSIKCPAGMPR